MFIYRLRYIKYVEKVDADRTIKVWHTSDRFWTDINEAMEEAITVSPSRKVEIIQEKIHGHQPSR